MNAKAARAYAEARNTRDLEILPLLSSIYNLIKYEATENGRFNIQYTLPEEPELTEEQKSAMMVTIRKNGYSCTLNTNEHDNYEWLNISWKNNESK